MTQLDMVVLRPDLPGYVHGIVSLDPPGIQCDGCGRVDTCPTVALAVLRSDIGFLDRDSRRRMCRNCWQAEGRLLGPRYQLRRKDHA